MSNYILVQFHKISSTVAVHSFILYLAVKSMHIKKIIKMISITSERLVIDISLYFHCSLFWITSDFFIRFKMLFTSELQKPINFLFVNENIKYGYSFS